MRLFSRDHNYRHILYHIMAWAIFILYEVSVIILLTGKSSSFIDISVHYLLNILFFYLNAATVKTLLLNRRWLVLALLIVGEMVIYIALNYLFNDFLQLFNIEVSKPITNLKIFLVQVIWRGLYFLALSTTYAFAKRIILSHRQIIKLQEAHMAQLRIQNRLETDILIAKNAELKLQINPHLLFNTLNFIYNTVNRSSVVAGDAVMRLSEITRYTYLASQLGEEVTVGEELEQIYNYIAINQTRFNNKIFITINVEEGVSEIKIIPLVLLTLVENLFKHGDLTDINFPAKLSLIRPDNKLIFITENKKSPEIGTSDIPHTGINNIIFRLQNFYQTDYSFTVTDGDLIYKTKLEISYDNAYKLLHC